MSPRRFCRLPCLSMSPAFSPPLHRARLSAVYPSARAGGGISPARAQSGNRTHDLRITSSPRPIGVLTRHSPVGDGPKVGELSPQRSVSHRWRIASLPRCTTRHLGRRCSMTSISTAVSASCSRMMRGPRAGHVSCQQALAPTGEGRRRCRGGVVEELPYRGPSRSMSSSSASGLTMRPDTLRDSTWPFCAGELLGARREDPELGVAVTS